jgi:hypothetical protein
MTLNEAARILLWKREDVKQAIEIGVMPPGSQTPVKLRATISDELVEIDDADLDEFIAAFESAEPGRHPPVGVRRQLFFEAREQCCVCGVGGPFEFHHLLDWAKLKHHDPAL